MEIFWATTPPIYHHYGDFTITQFVWGAGIFLVLFIAFFVVWKVIEQLRNRKK